MAGHGPTWPDMKPSIERELEALRGLIAGLTGQVVLLTRRVAVLEAAVEVLQGTPTFGNYIQLSPDHNTDPSVFNRIYSHIDDPNGVIDGQPGDISQDSASGLIWICSGGTTWRSL